MTLQEAKSIARHLGLTLRKVRSGDYRVNFRDGNEMTPYYSRLDNFSGQLHIPARWFKYIACSRQDRRDD